MNRLLVTVAVLAAPLWGQSIGNSFSFGGSGSVYSSLGATIFLRDTAQSIAVDTSGNVIVAGTAFSPDFPQVHALTQVAFPCEQGCGIFRAPFVAKLDATGSSLVYATLPRRAIPHRKSRRFPSADRSRRGCSRECLCNGNHQPAEFPNGERSSVNPAGRV